MDIYKNFENDQAYTNSVDKIFYFILTSETNAYKKQIKMLSITSEMIMISISSD